MRARPLFAMALALVLLGCQAKEDAAQPAPGATGASAAAGATNSGLRQELNDKARQRNGGNEPTKLDLWNELRRKAEEAAGAAKQFGEPRIVPKGAKPVITIKGSEIRFNGTQLKLGDSVAAWKSSIPERARCDTGRSGPMVCKWDKLGITIGTGLQNTTRVKFVGIDINAEPKDPYAGLVATNPDGTPAKALPDLRPKHVFPGYLEFDGFGIDAETRFWEIRQSVDRGRSLRCGLRDCSHPHGAFSDTASLYLRLSTGDEYGKVYELQISSDALPAASGPEASRR